MNAQQLNTLIDYNYWANHRMLDGASAFAEEELRRDLNASHQSIFNTLVHVMGAEWIWLERWKGHTPAALPAAEEFSSLATLRDRWSALEAEMRAFAASLTEADTARGVAYVTSRGEHFSLPLWQMMQHLANHSSYHRGTITTLLRQLGAKPPSTDLFLYYLILSGQKT